MAKLIKKSKCKFDNGYIVKKDKIVGIPYDVWAQLRKLEITIQQYEYLKDQPAYCTGPNLENFEFQSSLKNDRPYFEAPETPVTDKRVAEAMAFMDEVDKVNDVKDINEAIDSYGKLIDWLASDKFIEGDCYRPIETYYIGNPLNLKPSDVAICLANMVKNPAVLVK